jgi:uncharacterized delta-60 repeat protein
MAVKRGQFRRTAIAAVVASFLGLWPAGPAGAAESLDPSFGAGGVSVPGTPFSGVEDLAQDSEGRLVAALAQYEMIGVGRYLTDGERDPGFAGGEGDTSTGLAFHPRANAVAVQRDGKIVVAGSSETGSFILVRYQPAGDSRDPSFGRKRGYVVTPAGPLGGGARDVEIEPDGRILTAGYAVDARHRWDAIVTAHLPNGAPDRSFGSGGIIRFGAPGRTQIGFVSLETLPDGRILLAGTLDGQVMLLMLRPDGRVDRSFGGDGMAVTDVDASRRCACAYAVDMEVDRRGRIVVAANVTGPEYREPVALVRYRPNGQLDRSFGEKGVARAVLGTRLAGKDLAIQRNGRLVLAGTYNVPRSGEARVAVARFLPGGAIDRSFARRGFFTYDFGAEGVAYAALVQRDGRVVVGGRANREPSERSVYETAEVFLMRFCPGTEGC